MVLEMHPLWRLLLRPDKINDVSRPVFEPETQSKRRLKVAQVEWEKAFSEFERAREAWRAESKEADDG